MAALRIRLSRLGIEPWMLLLAGLVLLGLGLRLWGLKYGLPFAYQIDEERIYVRKAVRMLGEGSLDPNYFHNPPLYTYLLAAVYGVAHGASDATLLIGAVPERGSLFIAGRVLAALFGALAVWLVYVAGTRFFDRRTGLFAALLMAVGFLPVFYSHVALDNVPAMAAACVALIGAAGVLSRGHRRDYVLAGVGFGLAAVTKYIDGIVLVPLLAAVLLAPTGGEAMRRSRGLALMLGLATATFLICNPYAILDWEHFRAGLNAQGDVVDEHKFGQDPDGGIPYYLWTFTWGLGWVPALAAVAGAVLLWREDRRKALVLLPVLPIFIVYMGVQTRYFGRWMLPVYPILCMLAAYAAVRAIDFVAQRRSRLVPAATAVAAIALAGQSLVYSIHNDRVLSRPHTLNVARTWMLENIPPTAGVVTEPFRARAWTWYWEGSIQSLYHSVGLATDDYAAQLSPQLVEDYQRLGYCWVVASSNYWGLALDDPFAKGAPGYYRALEREGTLEFSASPWGEVSSDGGPGEDVVEFNYDWSYDFYPMAYERPGPMVLVYRLHGGLCRAENPRPVPFA